MCREDTAKLESVYVWGGGSIVCVGRIGLCWSGSREREEGVECV